MRKQTTKKLRLCAQKKKKTLDSTRQMVVERGF